MSNYNNNKPFESIMDKLQKKTPKVPPKPTLKDKAVRKPNAVPPKTRYIKMQDGGMAIKKRPEDMQERLERLIHKFEDGPKPKHYDDKSIVDQEEWNNMTPLQKKTPIIQRPKKFDNNDPSTYPMNQKKALSSCCCNRWDHCRIRHTRPECRWRRCPGLSRSRCPGSRTWCWCCSRFRRCR